MNWLHIAVKTKSLAVDQGLQKQLAPLLEEPLQTVTADEDSALRKALCVTAKNYDVVLLTGDYHVCTSVVTGLVGQAPQKLDPLPDGTEGWVYDRQGRYWIWLPAETEALTALLYERVLPMVFAQAGRPRGFVTFGIYGLSTATLHQKLQPLLADSAVQTSLFRCGEEWRLHWLATVDQAQELAQVTQEVKAALGQYVYATDGSDLMACVGKLLAEKQLTVALSGETGGLSVDKVTVADVQGDTARATALAARKSGENELGGAWVKTDDVITVALADSQRVWCKEIPADGDPARQKRRAQMEWLDLLRRYLEALPMVIAGGENIVESSTEPIIPVSPLQNRRPILFRKAESRSEKIFKTSLIILLLAILAIPLVAMWYFYWRDPAEIAAFQDLYELYQSEVDKQHSAGDFPLGMQPQFYALYAQNEDVRGWLKIDDHNSFPVMSDVNDEQFYRNHNYNKQESVYGVPYFYTTAPVQRGNRNLIIYGNRTEDEEMFSCLVNYLDEDYACAHSTIQMNTIYADASWVLFAVASVQEGDESFNYTRKAFRDDADFLKYVQELRDRSPMSFSTPVTETDDLLILMVSAPDITGMDDGLLLVAFRKLKKNETVDVTVVSATKAPQSSTGTSTTTQPTTNGTNGGSVTSAPTSSSATVTTGKPPSIATDPGGSDFVAPVDPPEDDEPQTPSGTSSAVTTTRPSTTVTTNKTQTTTTKRPTTKTTTTTVTTTTTKTTTATTTTVTTITSTSTPKTSASVTSSSATTSTGVSTSGTSGATSSSTATSSTNTSTHTTSTTATTTTTTGSTTTKPSVYTPSLQAGKIVESQYYSLFRLKNTRTGEIFQPKTKEDLQLGVFYLLKRELGSGITMKKSTAAQKAQAVASYTFVLYYCSTTGEPYPFAFDTYDPNNANDKKLYQAVGEVLGVKIIYPQKAIKSQAINAMYSSSSCGVTATCSKVYTANLPYLVSVASPYDTDEYIKKYSNRGAQNTATFTITLKELLEAVADEEGISAEEIERETKGKMPVYARSWDGGEGNYVYQTNLYYYKSGKKTYIKGKDIRSAVSGMRSHAFEVTAYDSKTDELTIVTRGYGHGLGLSQYGAVGYANEAGWTYDQILAHYYSITDNSAYQLVAPKWE